MGFENGEIYKISCIADETVLDLSGASTGNAADIITWSFNGADNQLWLATKADAGWELSSLVQARSEPEITDNSSNENLNEGETGEAKTETISEPLSPAVDRKCLDQDMKNGRLLHYTKKDGFNFNQQWYAKEVTEGVRIYTITNVASSKCITGHGSGKNVTCEKAERKNNSKQQWLLTPVEK